MRILWAAPHAKTPSLWLGDARGGLPIESSCLMPCMAYPLIPNIPQINDRWGEFVITPALMMGMGYIILDRISFGGVKELEEIYSD